MANPEHVSILREGSVAWNEWRRSTNPIPDLAGADLQQRDLFGIDFSGTNLSNVNLQGANLSESTLKHAILTRAVINDIYANGANADNVSFINTLASQSSFGNATMRRARFASCSFERANLTAVDFTGALFEGASLRHSNLTNAIFRQAMIRGLDLTNCKIGATVFADVSLERAAGLASIRHVAGSSVGIETYFLSRGLPDVFLRGVGTPEDFVSYAASLVGKAIDFHSCFISYSSTDDDFARRLHEALQGRHIRTWFAPEDLKTGDRLRDTIDNSIRIHDKLLLVLSESSIGSQWVEHEVEAALEREREEQRTLLFPVRIDDSIFETHEGWAGLIRRTRHIGDFRMWKNHDQFQNAFERLVRDLRKDGAVAIAPVKS